MFQYSRAEIRRPKRKGTPFTMYFSDQQIESLNRISRERRVSKAELVRIGVELLFAHLSGGQLELPLGIEVPLSICASQEQEP